MLGCDGAILSHAPGQSCSRGDCTQLVERFGAARDEWIRDDLAGWLAPNRIYDGIADALRSLKQRDDVYIVTTKQACHSSLLSTSKLERQSHLMFCELLASAAVHPYG